MCNKVGALSGAAGRDGRTLALRPSPACLRVPAPAQPGLWSACALISQRPHGGTFTEAPDNRARQATASRRPRAWPAYAFR